MLFHFYNQLQLKQLKNSDSKEQQTSACITKNKTICHKRLNKKWGFCLWSYIKASLTIFATPAYNNSIGCEVYYMEQLLWMFHFSIQFMHSYHNITILVNNELYLAIHAITCARYGEPDYIIRKSRLQQESFWNSYQPTVIHYEASD